MRRRFSRQEVDQKEYHVAGKDEKNKQEKGLGRWWRETIGELRKVTWPTRQEATNMTIIVLIVMTFMAIFLFLVDIGAGELLALLLKA
jgi:preprotein translocase subunit SecE